MDIRIALTKKHEWRLKQFNFEYKQDISIFESLEIITFEECYTENHWLLIIKTSIIKYKFLICNEN